MKNYQIKNGEFNYKRSEKKKTIKEEKWRTTSLTITTPQKKYIIFIHHTIPKPPFIVISKPLNQQHTSKRQKKKKKTSKSPSYPSSTIFTSINNSAQSLSLTLIILLPPFNVLLSPSIKKIKLHNLFLNL